MGYILAIATLSPSGFAALGGTSESVKSDQTQMKAKLKATPADAYSIHEITAPTGGFLESAGKDRSWPICGNFWEIIFCATPKRRRYSGRNTWDVSL
jgi:hypothetical protein